MADSDWIDDDGDWVDDDGEFKVHPLESAVRGAAQGATLGYADEIAGGIESLISNKPYSTARDESRIKYQEAEKANPMTYGAGNIAGGVSTAFIPGLNIAKGATLAGIAAKSALAGGAAGLGVSDADLTKGEFVDAAIDTGKGAALGGALGFGAEGVTRGLRRIPGMLDDLAVSQSARAQGLERGTMKKLGPDKVRDIGRHGLDEKIVTPFASTEEMIARNDAAKSRGGGMMEEVYSQVDSAGASTFNPLNVASKVDEQIGGFYRSPINRGESNQLENTLESILMRGDRNIPLAEAQALKQELGKVANWKNSLNVTDKERMAREAYGVVSGAIDEATEAGAKAIGNDSLLETLQRGKDLYGKAKGSEQLLENKLAREQGNKMFGLTDAIVGTGAGAAVGGPAGIAVLGAKKVAENYGNQIAAVGADALSKIMKSAPQKLGKFASVLRAAEQRGPKGMAATHFILQQTNPEYRQVLLDVADGPQDQSESYGN